MGEPHRRTNLAVNMRTGLLELNLQAWIRRQPWLQRIYRLFPRGVRNRVTAAMSSRAHAYARFPRTPAWEAYREPPTPRPSVIPDVGLPGVNLLGYIRGKFGLAESVRAYARALIGAGAPVALFDVDLGLPHSWDDHSLDAFIDEHLPHQVSIVFVNPDYLQAALNQIGRARLENHYIIACWFWELERIPDAWREALAGVDEVMVSSEFIAQAMSQVTDKPILRVPLPLAALPDSKLQRADFGLETGKFIFLCSFDFHSYIARKNPHAVIQAFKHAFADGRDDVRLLVKTSNGHLHPDLMRDLLNAVASDPRITIRDEVIDRAHVFALQRCCDAYVSLHRAEGFGLGLAECMAMGKPVIATGWSGNMEFMSADNACLVDYELVPVRDGEYPDARGARWADADIGSAAAAMRRLADDPGYAQQLGERARREVSSHLAPERAAERLLARVAEISAQAMR